MVIFEFSVINTQVISGNFRTKGAGDSITVYWGDGTSDVYAGTTNQNYGKNYGSAGNRTVTVEATDESVMTHFRMDQSVANIQCDLADLPSGMTYLYVTGTNTITGDLASLPSGVTYFAVTGSNTITGDLVNIPSGVTFFIVIGSNTINKYSGKAWTTNMSRFWTEPVYPGGLSYSELDQLLIDLEDDLTWTSSDRIVLTGANSPPSAASAVARASLEAMGLEAFDLSNTLKRDVLYKITSTQLNHFGTGLGVGDYFVSDGTETVDANNSAQVVLDVPVTGLHLVNAKGGSTRNMVDVAENFARNLINKIEVWRV